MALPTVHLHKFGWEVVCDPCGTVDYARRKREAEKIRREHLKLHCPVCGWLRSHDGRCLCAAEDKRNG